jgi:hypothetical protein
LWFRLIFLILDENTKGAEKLEWKVLIIICLLMFAAPTIVVDLATVAAFSTFSVNASLRRASLSYDSIEPLGDPVDIDEFPS